MIKAESNYWSNNATIHIQPNMNLTNAIHNNFWVKFARITFTRAVQIEEVGITIVYCYAYLFCASFAASLLERDAYILPLHSSTMIGGNGHAFVAQIFFYSSVLWRFHFLISNGEPRMPRKFNKDIKNKIKL